jgi:hypothetical protein
MAVLKQDQSSQNGTEQSSSIPANGELYYTNVRIPDSLYVAEARRPAAPLTAGGALLDGWVVVKCDKTFRVRWRPVEALNAAKSGDGRESRTQVPALGEVRSTELRCPVG